MLIKIAKKWMGKTAETDNYKYAREATVPRVACKTIGEITINGTS